MEEREPIRWWSQAREAVADRKAILRPWPKGFVLHHTWRPSLKSAKERRMAVRIHKFHKITRGWRRGLGYHFLIEADGSVAVGPRWRHQWDGAHARGVNKTTVGIALVGNFDCEVPRKPQLVSLLALVRELRVQLASWKEKALPDIVHYHSDFAPKTCPGRWWRKRREALIEAILVGSPEGIL